MKQLIYKCFALLVFSSVVFSSAVFAQKDITIEDIFVNGTFSAKGVAGFNALEDGVHYTKIDVVDSVQYINEYELATGKKVRTLYTHKGDAGIEKYTLSKDLSKALIYTSGTPIYRHSATYKVAIVDLKSGHTTPVNAQAILHASFNPQATQVAYVLNNNLYAYNIAQQTAVQITRDGAYNQIINGNCDWVYEEEFGFTQAYQWSPTGDFIAYYKFDESAVKEFTMDYYAEGNNYPEAYTFKYPKAGEANSVVNIYSYNVQAQQSVKMDIGTEKDQYIPRIKWANANELCIYRLNRLQNHLELLFANPINGTSKVVFSEKNKYYVAIDDNIYFLNNGKQMIYVSEKDGYKHLYRYDFATQKSKALTAGKWDLDALVGVDEQTNMAYFTAGKSSPMNREFFALKISNGSLTKLSALEGWNTVIPCTGYKYFLLRHQSTTSVPTSTLINAKGKIVRVLETNDALKERLTAYNLGELSFIKVPGAFGDTLNAYQILPPNFDANKQYPVLMYQYSGPGSQQVTNKYQLDSYFWHQYLAQNGYIVVVADGTGTGGRGEEFKKKTYLQLGKLESDDQIAVAEYLATLPYVNADRIGIWGWSYGGFMSSTCLFKAPKTFKAAIAVAPVTNWRFYDNIYTERYMRTPQENPKGYDENAPEQMAAQLEGKFMLIHGLADDNVHFQNAAVLTQQLIKNGKQFQSEYYPNGNHGIGGGKTRVQLYQRMSDFIFLNL